MRQLATEAFLLVLMMPVFSAAQGMMDRHGMHPMCGGMGGGFMMIMASIFWILLLVIMVLTSIWLVKQIKRT
jgi:uncharacterized membrane protein